MLAKRFNLIFIATCIICGIIIFTYNYNKLNYGNRWYAHTDMDVYALSDSLALNSGEMLDYFYHPSFMTTYLYAMYLKVLDTINPDIINSLDDFKAGSKNPVIQWQGVIRNARIFSWFLALTLCFVVTLIAWKLTDTPYILGIAFLVSTTCAGPMFQALIIRSELINVLLGTISFLLTIMAFKTEKKLGFMLFSIFSGIFFSLSMTTKMMSLPYIVIATFFALFILKVNDTIINNGKDHIKKHIVIKLGSFKFKLKGAYYIKQVLPTIGCLFITILILLFIHRNPRLYYLAFVAITMLTPIYCIVSVKWGSSWVTIKVEYLIYFFSGITFGLAAPFFMLLPILGLNVTYDFVRYRLIPYTITPELAYKMVTPGGREMPFDELYRVFLDYIRYYRMIFLFYTPVIFGPVLLFFKDIRKNIIFFVIVVIGSIYSFCLAYRGGFTKYYLLYTDVFLVVAISIAFVVLLEYFGKKFYTNKKIINIVFFAIFIVSLVLSYRYQYSKILPKISYYDKDITTITTYKDLPQNVCNTSCGPHTKNPYVNNKYCAIIKEVYGTKEACFHELEKFLKIVHNNYARW